MKRMRLFLGINLSPDVRGKLTEICSELKQAGGDMKWVCDENIHLTLKFLGDTDRKQADRIIGALEMKPPPRAFTLRFTGIGKFGRGDELKVLWAGVEKEEKLEILFNGIEARLETLGIPRENRNFSPHITLARNRVTGIPQPFIKKLTGLGNIIIGEQAVDSFRLDKSILSPSGPAYTVMRTFPLEPGD